MDITLNGKLLVVEGITTVAGLLAAKGYNGKLVAVAMNGQFIPKEKYEDTPLSFNDKIEIVAPMQGG